MSDPGNIDLYRYCVVRTLRCNLVQLLQRPAAKGVHLLPRVVYDGSTASVSSPTSLNLPHCVIIYSHQRSKHSPTAFPQSLPTVLSQVDPLCRRIRLTHCVWQMSRRGSSCAARCNLRAMAASQLVWYCYNPNVAASRPRRGLLFWHGPTFAECQQRHSWHCLLRPELG